MKLILNESQYNRLFLDKKKRKIVITESQYERLISEAGGSNILLGIDKSDTVKIITNTGDKLHFKAVSKNGNEIIMINCNDGVYKNAYFYLSPNSFTGKDLHYKLAQNKDIEDTNPWGTLSSDVWRKSVFKDITEFEVFKNGGEGLTCNLLKDAEKKFSIDMDTGKIEEPEEGKEKVEDIDEKKLLKTFKAKFHTIFKEGFVYRFILIGDSFIDVHVIGRDNKVIEMELVDYSGDQGSHYKGLMDEGFRLNLMKPSNFNVEIANDINKPVYSIMIDEYTGELDDERNKITEEGLISNILYIRAGEEYSEYDIEDDEILSQAEIRKAMEGDERLRDLIQYNPGSALEFLGLVRKQGVIPSEEIFRYWGAQADKSSLTRFKADKMVSIKFVGDAEIYDAKYDNELRDFIRGTKAMGNDLAVKVGRFDGGKYMTLKGKLDKKGYELRVPNQNVKEEDTYVVDIVIKEPGSKDKKLKLAKAKIKVLSYDI